MYDARSLYEKKLTDPEEAVSEIKSGTALSFGMAAGQPPALLGAIASRIRRGDLGDLRIYYKLAMKHAAETVLADDVLHAVHPCPMFMTDVDRHIADQQRHSGKKILSYVPAIFTRFQGSSRNSFPSTLSLLRSRPWTMRAISASAPTMTMLRR